MGRGPGRDAALPTAFRRERGKMLTVLEDNKEYCLDSLVFTCGEACKSRDNKKSVGGGGGVVVCPELLSKEEVELWFCPELLAKTLVNGKNDA